MDKGRNVLDSTGVNVPMGSIANLIIIVVFATNLDTEL